MGKDWDSGSNFISKMTEIFKETLRVLKPGAHGLVWALPRTSHWTATALEQAGFEIRDVITHLFGQGFPKSHNLGNGQGTALKPACEMWVLVRKPLSEKNIAANVMKWGTGGINIDQCRVSTNDNLNGGTYAKVTEVSGKSGSLEGGPLRNACGKEFQQPAGRFPSNLVIDEVAAEILDEQSGVLKSGDLKPYATDTSAEYCQLKGVDFRDVNRKGDSGGASRFFYVAKASKKDRGEDNNHPTVKSTKLMEYLITLITPKNGIVLDPFMGSGSTGKAAKLLGFEFIGIEKEEEYFKIAEKRCQIQN